MNFTVLAPGYFDDPGSTIEFSTWTDDEGMVFLRQRANATGTPLSVKLGVELELLGGARHTWSLRAQNLREVISNER